MNILLGFFLFTIAVLFSFRGFYEGKRIRLTNKNPDINHMDDIESINLKIKKINIITIIVLIFVLMIICY